MPGETRKIEPNVKDCGECLCFSCAEKGKYEKCRVCPCTVDDIAGTSRCIFFRMPRKSLARAYCVRLVISALYHVTIWKNLESILRVGLLCRNRIESQNMAHEGFAYETALRLRAQKRIGNKSAQDYVPLFFHQLPPMLRKLQHVFSQQEIVYIRISPEILGENGVCFTDRNLAATGSQVFHEIEGLLKLQWRIIQNPTRAPTQTEESRIQGAEVLVPERIDPSWFNGIIVYDEYTKTILRSTLLKICVVPIEVKPEFYF